jgi:hypothetical protein
MKQTVRAFALLLVLTSAMGAVSSNPIPKPSPEGQNNYDMSIFDQPQTKSGSPDYTGRLQLYSKDDKEHVFEMGPDQLYALSGTSVNTAGYSSSLNPQNQNNVGFGIGIPFGSTEPDKAPPKGTTGSAGENAAELGRGRYR